MVLYKSHSGKSLVGTEKYRFVPDVWYIEGDFVLGNESSNSPGNMAKVGDILLKTAGWLNVSIALLHVGIVFAGASAYRYFGAGDQMAAWAEAGSLLPAVVTLCLAIVFGVFGLYAFSGAAAVRRLPLLAPALIFTGIMYTGPGLVVSPTVILSLSGEPLLAPKKLVFSFVALGIGLLYLSGTIMVWERLRKNQRRTVWTTGR